MTEPNVEPEDSEGYGPIGPGDNSKSELEDELEKIDPKSRVGAAHYEGMTETEAAETWARESLCRTCVAFPICKVADGVSDPLVVVSRCLAYLPGGG